MGVMNTPYKSSLRESIFYLPRYDEMVHENALIENHIHFRNVKLKDKFKKRQLPDVLMQQYFTSLNQGGLKAPTKLQEQKFSFQANNSSIGTIAMQSHYLA